MRRQLLPALRMLLVVTVLGGVAYPLAILGFAQLAFPHQANGSVVRDASGRIVGSTLIGQPFSAARYFHPRPSAAGDGYDAEASGASNLGPSDPALLATVRRRVRAYRAENGLGASTPVPADAVTASASGLDPDISLANARLQAARIARARNLPLSAVVDLIRRHERRGLLGVIGVPDVNVLELNLALDATRQ